ncbi:MAG: hypothetical protein K6T91_05515 [Firmicutes bacterium]|nr:hypothetical protein [Bacillota bacterium]
MAGIGLVEVILILMLIVLPAVAVWKISSRVGLPPVIAVTQFFPVVNIVGLLYIAFAQWPNYDKQY